MDQSGESSKPVINVIATVQVKEGRREEFLALFGRLVPHVRAEAGCIEYGPTIDIQSAIPIQGPLRENTVVIIEKWVDLESLYVHLKAPHMVQYYADSKDLVEKTDLQILQSA